MTKKQIKKIIKKEVASALDDLHLQAEKEKWVTLGILDVLDQDSIDRWKQAHIETMDNTGQTRFLAKE